MTVCSATLICRRHKFFSEFELRKMMTEEYSMAGWPKPKISLFCTTCASTIEIGLHSTDADFIVQAAIDICLQFHMGNEVVCDGMVTKNAVRTIKS